MSVVPELQTWFILLNCYFSKSVYNGFSLFDFSWLDGFTVLVSKLKMRASLKNYKCCFAVIDNHFPSNEMFHHRMKLLIQYTVHARIDHLAGIHRWRVRAGKVPGTKRWDTVGVHARSQVNRSQQCDKNKSIGQSFPQHSECLSKVPTTQHRKIVAYEKNVYTFLKSI